MIGVRPVPISNPPNPWATTEVEYLEAAPEVRLEVFVDGTRNILSKNDSPDVGFTWSVNPYRGCFHACAYCYARPTHEYLSFGAGTDFDRKIVVKLEAPELLRAAFAKKSWRRETVVFSGVTDCYQPLEASYRLTRGCLEVCVERATRRPSSPSRRWSSATSTCWPSSARVAASHVTVSIPFWDAERARAIEPYVPTPARRLRVIETLAKRRDLRRRERRANHSGAQRPGHPADPGRRARRGRALGRARAVAAPGSGQGGVRGAAARGAAADGRARPPPRPRDARREALRFAVRRARAGRGDLRRRDPRAVRDDGPPRGFTLGAIPSDVQVDEVREQAARGGCMSMAMPASMDKLKESNGRRPAGARQAQLELPRLSGSNRRTGSIGRPPLRRRCWSGRSRRRAPAASFSAPGTTIAARQPRKCARSTRPSSR